MKQLTFFLTILMTLLLAGATTAVYSQDVDAIVTPDEADLDVGESLKFEVFAFSMNGSSRSPVDVDAIEWSVTPDSLGTITDDGFFMAGRHVGKVDVRVVIRIGGRTIVREIAIRIGRLPKAFFDLKIVPERAVVPVGGEQQFRAVVKRADTDILPTFVRWEVVPEDLGKINDDGLFQAGDVVGYGKVVAHVEIDGLKLRAAADIVVSPAATGAITGTVFSDADASPVTGGVVRAIRLGKIRWIQKTEVNENGEYVLGDLIPGIYVVTAHARGFIGEFFDDTRNYLEATPLAISEADTVDGVDFGLSEGGKITGTIVTEGDSVALGGAHVWAFLVVNPHFAKHVLTDDNGDYSIEALPTGSYVVAADANGYKAELYDDATQLSEATFVNVTEPDTEPDIDFALGAASAIQGVVTNEVDGSPIADAKILVYGRPEFSFNDRRILRQTRTNDAGEYLIEIRPGTYILAASARGFNSEFFENASNRSEATLVEVKPDSHTTDINFDLVPRSTITGTVTDETTGDPIAGAVVEAFKEHANIDASVTAAGFRALTDADGQYLIENVPAGRYIIVSHAEGFLPEFYQEASNKRDATIVEIMGNSGVSDIDFTLVQGGRIAGLVATAADSLPIPGALVRVFDTNSGRHIRGYTNREGLYEIGGLPTGSYLVQVIAEGFFSEFFENARHRGDATPVEVVAPETTPDIDFFLVPQVDRDGTIAGRVFSDDDETPLFGAVIIAVSPARRIPHITFSGPRGFYRLTDLPAGRYFVFAWAEGFVGEFYRNAKLFRNADQVIVVSNQVTAGINFGLRPISRRGAYAIRGRIRRADDSSPLEGILINARVEGEVEVNATTDTDGNYIIQGLPAGDYTIEATAPGYSDGYFGGTNANNAASVSVGEGVDAEDVNLNLNEDTVTDVSTGGEPTIPQTFVLQQNFPNPFNPQTSIRYQLAQNADVSLKVYNIMGQEVRTLVNDTQAAGSYQVKWDGKNDVGHQVASGIYIFRLKAGEQFKASRTMMLLK